MKSVRKAVVLLIRDSENRFLILKRGRKSRYEPGKWELCGGALEDGEGFEEAAKREALEELGVEINLKKRMYEEKYSDMGDGVVWEAVVFLASLNGQPSIQEPDKCSELQWVKKLELLEMKNDLATHFQEDLNYLGWL